MIWMVSAFSSILAVSCFFFLPFKKCLTTIQFTLKKSLNVIRSVRVSDHWKEQILPGYSLIVFKHTCLVAIYLCAVGLLIVGPGIFSSVYSRFILSPSGMVWVTVVSSIGIVVIKRQHNAKYNYCSILLHHLALDVSFIAEASFDVEQLIMKPRQEKVVDQKHVFIAGLARSGTTVLLRRFYASGRFRSLTYADMPFVLMPNVWHRLNKFMPAARAILEERAHKDGLLVDANSPEALDEIFWRTFAGKQYIHNDRLVPMTADGEVIEKFQDFIASVLACSKNANPVRYLSKNNNNILRLPSIREAFPNAVIIIPFRNPLQQAASLLSLHKQFSEDQRQNKFGRQYMQWLAHHEFGVDHRPFVFDGTRINEARGSQCLDYWLNRWMDAYGWVFDKAPENAVFLSYEALAQNLDDVWSRLTNLSEIPNAVFDADVVTFRKRDVHEPFNQKLLDEAFELYQKMIDRELILAKGRPLYNRGSSY